MTWKHPVQIQIIIFLIFAFTQMASVSRNDFNLPPFTEPTRHWPSSVSYSRDWVNTSLIFPPVSAEDLAGSFTNTIEIIENPNTSSRCPHLQLNRTTVLDLWGSPPGCEERFPQLQDERPSVPSLVHKAATSPRQVLAPPLYKLLWV